MLVVYDEIYGDHLRGIPHPESPGRVEVVAAFLAARGLLSNRIAARDASAEEIARARKASPEVSLPGEPPSSPQRQPRKRPSGKTAPEA